MQKGEYLAGARYPRLADGATGAFAALVSDQVAVPDGAADTASFREPPLRPRTTERSASSEPVPAHEAARAETPAVPSGPKAVPDRLPPLEPLAEPEIAPPAKPAPRAAESFGDLARIVAASVETPPVSETASYGVPVETVEKIAQRVVAQISEKAVREIAWEVIPDLAEALIRQEIEKLKAELSKL